MIREILRPDKSGLRMTIYLWCSGFWKIPFAGMTVIRTEMSASTRQRRRKMKSRKSGLKVVVIGGGASGMVAAIVAARNGASVTILERMQKVGRKLLATGNGRCNLSNQNLYIDRYHGSNRVFVEDVLSQFNVQNTVDFFDELGLLLKQEEDGKLFPWSDQASSVLDVLRYEMNKLGIEVIGDTRVQRIDGQEDAFTCHCTDGKDYDCDRVIIATGGQSSPNLGSNGAGFKIAKALGHNIIKPFPALVQLNIDAPFLKRLKGLRFEGAAETLVNGRSRRKEEGEILFTEYGLSGPPILLLSRIVSESLEKDKDILIGLDLFPSFSQQELVDNINRRM